MATCLSCGSLFRVIILIINLATLFADESQFYQFSAKNISTGEEVSFSKYKGKIVLVVNVASECGFTDKNYKELVELQKAYDYDKFAVMAFPCNQFGEQERKKNKDIVEFAVNNYNANFDMFQKVNTINNYAHPLYQWLKRQSDKEEPTWNFTKYLLDGRGEVVRYASAWVSPLQLNKDIQDLLSGEQLGGGMFLHEARGKENEHTHTDL